MRTLLIVDIASAIASYIWLRPVYDTVWLAIGATILRALGH